MNLTHIPFAEFCKRPWKNGLGTTHDIHLAPEGADHSTFEVRCAFSPIVEDNVFSSFPGIERVITPVVGNGIELQFEDETVRVTSGQGHRFDTGLTPMGRLIDGPISVVNVMARRNVWRIERCEVATTMQQNLDGDAMAFVFALGEAVVTSGEEQVSLEQHDALLAHGAGALQCNDKVLFAHLSPVQ